MISNTPNELSKKRNLSINDIKQICTSIKRNQISCKCYQTHKEIYMAKIINSNSSILTIYKCMICIPEIIS